MDMVAPLDSLQHRLELVHLDEFYHAVRPPGPLPPGKENSHVTVASTDDSGYRTVGVLAALRVSGVNGMGQASGLVSRSPAPQNVSFNANWTARASRVSVTTAKLLASGRR